MTTYTERRKQNRAKRLARKLAGIETTIKTEMKTAESEQREYALSPILLQQKARLQIRLAQIH